MGKIQPYTVDEHREIAARMNAALNAVSALAEGFNRPGHRIAVKFVDEALKHFHGLETLRVRLDDEMFRHNQSDPACTSEIYFPSKAGERPQVRQ